MCAIVGIAYSLILAQKVYEYSAHSCGKWRVNLVFFVDFDTGVMSNGDENRTKIAENVVKNRGYAAEHPLTRNWWTESLVWFFFSSDRKRPDLTRRRLRSAGGCRAKTFEIGKLDNWIDSRRWRAEGGLVGLVVASKLTRWPVLLIGTYFTWKPLNIIVLAPGIHTVAVFGWKCESNKKKYKNDNFDQKKFRVCPRTHRKASRRMAKEMQAQVFCIKEY